MCQLQLKNLLMRKQKFLDKFKQLLDLDLCVVQLLALFFMNFSDLIKHSKLLLDSCLYGPFLPLSYHQKTMTLHSFQIRVIRQNMQRILRKDIVKRLFQFINYCFQPGSFLLQSVVDFYILALLLWSPF